MSFNTLMKENGHILFRVEMDRRRREDKCSRGSGMESNLFLSFYITLGRNLPI